MRHACRLLGSESNEVPILSILPKKAEPALGFRRGGVLEITLLPPQSPDGG